MWMVTSGQGAAPRGQPPPATGPGGISGTALSIATGATQPAASERLLLDIARRLERQPAGCMALVLHLSRMPAARPHHRRIARAMMHEVAQRQDGQVFVLRNSDLVLLCRAVAAPKGGRAAAKGVTDFRSLPGTLEQLMQVDAPETGRLVSHWSVEQEPEALVVYANARLAETVVALPADEDVGGPAGGQVGAIGTMASLAADSAAVDLIHRQTAVQLLASRPRHGEAVDGGALRPLYSEIGFSVAALEARAGLGVMAESDSFLFRHLASRLDQRLLELVAEALGTDGPLDPLRQRKGTPPLHLNLTLPALLSNSFAGLVAASQASGVSLGVEVAFSEACSDPEGFARARDLVADTGVTLTLDGVSHLTMVLTQPWMLGADLIKLDWSARLSALAGAEAEPLQVALRRCGAHRLVLHRADSEAAIRWGMSQGIRRFQGRHIDAMLAAARMMACAKSDACTLRQCMERAGAVAPAGRSFCRNTALLDAGAP